MVKDINSAWKKYEDNSISHSATHYLFTIHELLEKNGYARMIDISKKLKITPGSCSTGLKSLLKKGFILEDSNKFVKLAEKGNKIIEDIIKARETLIIFFRDELKLSEEKAITNACKIEHLLGNEVIDKLRKYSK